MMCIGQVFFNSYFVQTKEIKCQNKNENDSKMYYFNLLYIDLIIILFQNKLKYNYFKTDKVKMNTSHFGIQNKVNLDLADVKIQDKKRK